MRPFTRVASQDDTKVFGFILACSDANFGVRMLNFEAFWLLHPEGQEAVRSFRQEASRASNPISVFSYIWFSFNSWLNCVSGEEQDSKMIRAAAIDPILDRRFTELMENDLEFGNSVKQFSTWWPIFNVQDIRRYGGASAPFEYFNRADFYETHKSDKRLRRRPERWTSHGEATWPDLLSACYQVRCNLFHGDKALSRASDRDIIESAADCLSQFIDRSGIYDPGRLPSRY